MRQGWGQISTAGSGSSHAHQPKKGRRGRESRDLRMERYSAEGPRGGWELGHRGPALSYARVRLHPGSHWLLRAISERALAKLLMCLLVAESDKSAWSNARQILRCVKQAATLYSTASETSRQIRCRFHKSKCCIFDTATRNNALIGKNLNELL